MKLFRLSSEVYRALFARRFFYKWNRWVLQCGLKGIGVGNFAFSTSGEHSFLKQTIGKAKEPVLFDVGANVGDWTKIALQINSSSRIYAFEPNPLPFQQLLKITGIKAYNQACSDHEGKRVLYDRADQTSGAHASLDREVLASLNKGVTETEVKVVTLDSIINAEKITHIDLLKIDVEGYEYEVLKGGYKALRSEMIQTIQFEFNSMNIFRRRFLRDFQDLLPNYEFFRLLPKGKIPLRFYDPVYHEIFSYQNIVACRKH
ncbi:MAG: FkbM family methyltransferase [Chlamydiales bacterium]